MLPLISPSSQMALLFYDNCNLKLNVELPSEVADSFLMYVIKEKDIIIFTSTLIYFMGKDDGVLRQGPRVTVPPNHHLIWVEDTTAGFVWLASTDEGKAGSGSLLISSPSKLEHLDEVIWKPIFFDQDFLNNPDKLRRKQINEKYVLFKKHNPYIVQIFDHSGAQVISKMTLRTSRAPVSVTLDSKYFVNMWGIRDIPSGGAHLSQHQWSIFTTSASYICHAVTKDEKESACLLVWNKVKNMLERD